MEYETIKYRGKDIEIFYDENPQCPRTEWDNLCTMVCFHDRYNLGAQEHNFDNPAELQEFVERSNVIDLPLYLYDHICITMQTE